MNNDSAEGIEQIQSDLGIRVQAALVGLLVTFCSNTVVKAQEATLAYYTCDSEAEENQVRVVNTHRPTVSIHQEEAGCFAQRLSTSAAQLAARRDLASAKQPANSEAIGAGSQNEIANRTGRRVGVLNPEMAAQLGRSATLRAAPERTTLASSRWTRVEPAAERFNRPEVSIQKRTSLGPAPRIRTSPQDLIPMWRQSPRAK